MKYPSFNIIKITDVLVSIGTCKIKVFHKEQKFEKIICESLKHKWKNCDIELTSKNSNLLRESRITFQKGIPDIIMKTAKGKIQFIEIKRNNDALRKDQMKFLIEASKRKIPTLILQVKHTLIKENSTSTMEKSEVSDAIPIRRSMLPAHAEPISLGTARFE